MKLSIPKEPTYIVPEGQYRAILTNVINLEDKKQVRLVFHLQNDEGHPFLAGKNYSISDAFTRNGDLRQDLKSWRGRDFTADEARNGSFDLETLLGQQADLVIGHRHNAKFDNPYVFIAEILPAGSIVPEGPIVLQPAFSRV